jgi:hypothetical protein
MKRKESKNIKTRQHPNDANLFWCSYHKEYHQRQEFSMSSRSPHGISYICRIANKICHYQSMLKREAICPK